MFLSLWIALSEKKKVVTLERIPTPTRPPFAHAGSIVAISGLLHLPLASPSWIGLKKCSNLIGPTKFQPLPHRYNVSSLCLYKYFHGLFSSSFIALVPTRRTYPRQNRLATKSHPFTFEVRNYRKVFYFNNLFPKTARLLNFFPVIFPRHDPK